MAIEKILFLGDVHAPFEDRTALSLFFTVGAQWKPKHLVCLGDLMDCYSVSSHSKDPKRKADLAYEIGYAEALMDRLDGLKATSKFFIAGNHEHRLERFLADKAPQLQGLVSIPSALDLKRRGWRYTPYREHTTLGKLTLTHDVGYAGRYAAHRTLDALQSSVAFGHTHRLSLLVESNLLGEPKIAASFGWLGDLSQIDYMHKGKVTRDWSLGFGVGYLDTATGFVKLDAVPLLKHKKGLTCTVEGERFDAQ